MLSAPLGNPPRPAPAGSAEVASLLAQAVAFHQAGLLAEAERLYRRILQVRRRHFDALHLLGVIYAQRGDNAEAVRQFDTAVKIVPGSAVAHGNRGDALKELNRFDEALASYDKAFALKPDLPYLQGDRLHMKMHLCQWCGFEQ